MQRKIKKLAIKVEKGGLMCPQSGECMKQSITIKNNGQIWFNAWRNLTEEEVAKGFTNGEGFFVERVKITEQKNIGKEKAINILEKAEMSLPRLLDKDYLIHVCDAILDEVLIEYEDGEIVMGQIIDSPWDFYKYLAEETLIENLFFFDERILDDEKNGLDRWGNPIPKDRLAEGKYIDHAVYKDILLMAVEDIKGHADSYDEKDMYIRTGLYMALAIIKTRAQIGYDTYMEDENLENIFLERLGLDEDFEFNFFEEHKKD